MIYAITLYEALVGLIVAIPSVVLGYLGYRRARNIDRIAEQAGITTASATSIQQVMNGLNSIIENLRTDNRDLRRTVDELEIKTNRLSEDTEKLRLEIRNLKSQINSS